MNNLFSKTAMCALALIVVTSCKKDKTEDPAPTPATGYTIPTTYNFTNLNYSGQTTRLIMLDSITNYMKKGNNGILLSGTQMKNMYSNTGSPFGDAALDGSGKQLKNKTYSLEQSYFDGLFDSLAIVSQSGTSVGSNGVAGVVTSTANPSKKYLMDKNGLEYAQVIRKQLMGAVFYFQAIETYLASLPTDDNTTIVAGEGTVMEHHCDEAFGYFGVPVDFPVNLSGIKYWGDYCNEVNPAVAANTPLMNAFIKLRAAVSNKDNTTRDAQVVIIRQQWERVVAGAAILELTEAKTNFSDDAVRNHVLSEAVGFINSLKYNSNKQISTTQINTALSSLGTNFYTITITDIDNSINTINAVYNFNLSLF
ncbi:MAG: DUF4856 domain-containing protein [Bacteroidia bacterium]|nr:DUF4856 domain-containing protein [Bacteroidia bacterium]